MADGAFHVDLVRLYARVYCVCPFSCVMVFHCVRAGLWAQPLVRCLPLEGCSQWSMLFVRCLDVLYSPAMMRGLSIIRLPPCPISTTSGIWRHSRVRFNVRSNVVTNQPAVLVYYNGVAMDLRWMGYTLDALSSLRDESALSRPSTTSPPLLRESRTQRHVTWSATQ